MQRGSAHEIGHLLGLPHVDAGKPHCPSTNTNAPLCYVIKDVDKVSIMGYGMEQRVENAQPWRKAIIDMSKKGNFLRSKDWKAQLSIVYPKKKV